MNTNQSKNKTFKKLLFPAIAAVAATSLYPGIAFAQDTNQILNDSCDTVYLIKDWIFMISYILGAIGLVIIAISAFIGRFKFSHLIALGGGLFIVAGADLLITFITNGQSATCTTM